MDCEIFYKSPDGVDENFVAECIDAETLNAFAEKAQELNLSLEQAKGVWDFLVKGAAELCAEINAKCDAYYDDVRGEMEARYGAALPQKERAIADLINRCGGKAFADLLVRSGVGNRRETVEFFMNLIDSANEDARLIGDRVVPVADAAQIKEEIARLSAQPAYMRASHPDHARCVDKVFNLRKRLFNED